MNKFDKPLLHLDGLDNPGLYMQDIYIVRQHSDRNGYRYFSIFMLDNAYLALPGTEDNLTMLLQAGHRIYEYIFLDGRMVEEETQESAQHHGSA